MPYVFEIPEVVYGLILVFRAYGDEQSVYKAQRSNERIDKRRHIAFCIQYVICKRYERRILAVRNYGDACAAFLCVLGTVNGSARISRKAERNKNIALFDVGKLLDNIVYT